MIKVKRHVFEELIGRGWTMESMNYEIGEYYRVSN